MVFKEKDFFGMRDLTSEEIRYILSTAETMKYILNQKNKNHLIYKENLLLYYFMSQVQEQNYLMN